GHQKELEQLIYILSRLSRNNTALIGEVCAGKTAIVEGLVQRIVAGNVPESIKVKRVIKLDTNALMTGIKNGSQLEERLQMIKGELQQSGGVVFINDLYILSGNNKNNSDVIKILKLGLSQNKFQLIIAMSADEYSKYIERNHLLRRYFQSLMVTPDNS
ncbi:MAG TPA: NDP-hexose 4-ketoreductase, partial [Herpetosiphonaceae bacterium]